MKLIICTDGGSRGNPGEAAIGVVITDENGTLIKKYSEAIGEATNNEAEYQAVILALKKVKALFGKDKAVDFEIEIRSDSQLIVRQLNHQYKIEEESLFPYFIKIWNLTMDYKEVIFKEILREENKEADRLVNQALDKKQENLF